MIGDNWANALLWLYGAFSVFWLLQWWLSQHIRGLALLIFRRPGPASSIYFWLLAPGVILHELSHWFFAKILLVRTGDMALFRPTDSGNGKVTLGYVEVYRSDPIRQSLIGLAPLPIGIIALLILSALLGFNHEVTAQVAAGSNQWQTLSALPGQLITSFAQPLNFLWFYLVFTISNGMLPSSADRRPWLFGFILPSLVILGLALSGNLKLSEQSQQSILSLLGTLTWAFAFAGLLNLLIALLIAGLELLVSQVSRRRIVYRR